MITLSTRSKNNLRGVHPDLIKVVNRLCVISPMDFSIIEGLRTVAQQKENVAKGVSWTMNSRHLTGHAVDIAPFVGGKVSWAWPNYYELAKWVKQAAKDVGVTVEWGGDWKKTKDGPHWQLPFSKYPASKSTLMDLPAEVKEAPPYTVETEQAAHGKGVAGAVTGAVTGASVGLEPMKTVADSLVSQQSELTSGDILRIVVAVVIIASAAYFAWTKLRPAT